MSKPFWDSNQEPGDVACILPETVAEEVKAKSDRLHKEVKEALNQIAIELGLK